LDVARVVVDAADVVEQRRFLGATLVLSKSVAELPQLSVTPCALVRLQPPAAVAHYECLGVNKCCVQQLYLARFQASGRRQEQLPPAKQASITDTVKHCSAAVWQQRDTNAVLNQLK
jgi:hypothetical protein